MTLAIITVGLKILGFILKLTGWVLIAILVLFPLCLLLGAFVVGIFYVDRWQKLAKDPDYEITKNKNGQFVVTWKPKK